MFEEEISPEELFRQFFGGGMGGGGFGGGPFGGFGMYQNGGRKLLTQQLTRAQQAAETVSSSTWVADPESDYTRWAATILEEGHTTIPTPTVHHPSSVFPLLRRRTNLPKCPLRQPSTTAHTPPHFQKAQSGLLRQPYGNHRLLVSQLARSRQPRREQLCPKTGHAMRMGTIAQTTGLPGSARFLEQRPREVATGRGDDHACV
jgi:hypothetical protein